jgi:hypothetical protein
LNFRINKKDVSLMKKGTIGFYLLIVCVLAFAALTPVAARTTSWGWSMMPFTDAVDDVYQYSEGQHAWEGTQGDYWNEIDIQMVVATTTGLTIIFNATPVADEPHEYTIDIDMDGNGNSEFHISEWLGNFFLQRFSDGYYWNGADWTSSLTFISHGISGNNLTISSLTTALGSLDTAQIAVVVSYTGESPTYYADYAPGEPSGSNIPGFVWLGACFSLCVIAIKIRGRTCRNSCPE